MDFLATSLGHPPRNQYVGAMVHMNLVLIWYELIAYTCKLSALDFVSGR